MGKHQMIALAMLLGGDYTDGVKGVGIVNGMEILQAFPIGEDIHASLQKFREWLDGMGDPPSNADGTLSNEMIFHKKHKSARHRWVAPSDFPSQAIISAYQKPTVDKSEARFSWAKPNMEGLRHFCSETLGWDQEETSRIVGPVLKVLESGSKQTRLESYFMKYDDGIKFAEVRSKRLKAVLDGIQGVDDATGEDQGPKRDEDSKQPKKRKRRG